MCKNEPVSRSLIDPSEYAIMAYYFSGQEEKMTKECFNNFDHNASGSGETLYYPNSCFYRIIRLLWILSIVQETLF